MAVIHGKSCFEKNAFEDTENPHLPTKTRLPVKEYLGEIFKISKNFWFILKLFLQPILFHGKLSFDNLTYFKLYSNLNKWITIKCLLTLCVLTSHWIQEKKICQQHQKNSLNIFSKKIKKYANKKTLIVRTEDCNTAKTLVAHNMPFSNC